MILFLLKLIVTPALLVLVSLIQRKFGHRIGGIFMGLPVNFGVTSAFVAVEQGQAYVQSSAGPMMIGLVAIMPFYVIYLECAKRYTWPISILASLAAYFAIAFPLGLSPLPTFVQLGLSLIAPIGVLAYLKKQSHDKTTASAAGRTLWLRAITGVIVVFVITLLAHMLPPQALGLLAIAPVANSIMLVFSHRDYGKKVLNHFVLGAVTGIYGSIAFLAVLAWIPATWGTAIAFTLATVAALLATAVINGFSGKRRAATEEPVE
jgi:hypothetical protein